MAVYYALVNNIIMDCGIAEINPDHENGKEDYPQIWLIPDEAYMIISMDETSIVADQIKDMDQSKKVWSKGEGGRSTNKDEKGTNGGVLFSTAGLNWGDVISRLPMFVLDQGIPLPMSWMMLGKNFIACLPVSADA